jgi:hypothetical protein
MDRREDRTNTEENFSKVAILENQYCAEIEDLRNRIIDIMKMNWIHKAISLVRKDGEIAELKKNDRIEFGGRMNFSFHGQDNQRPVGLPCGEKRRNRSTKGEA